MAIVDPTADPAMLRQRLIEADAALHQLRLGAKVVSGSFNQGLGSKAVAYTPADIPQLSMYVASLKRQLGIVVGGRRAIRVSF